MALQENILREIQQERTHQDALHGGPKKDDQHTPADWVAILARHLGLAVGDAAVIDVVRYRRQLIRVAAVAVAAVESLDRRSQREQVFDLTEKGPGY